MLQNDEKLRTRYTTKVLKLLETLTVMFNRLTQDNVREAILKFLATFHKDLPITPAMREEIIEHLIHV